MRRVAALFALGLATCLSLLSSADAKYKVVLAELNWTGAVGIEHVLKTILESRLGADVEIIPADAAVIWAAMDKGDGSIDVFPDLWRAPQANAWAKYVAKGSRETVLVNDNPYSGESGLYVPGYVQEEHKIFSVEDLRSPEVAKLFDTNGDGKGEWWPGGPGWGTLNVELVKAKSYGYDKYFTPFIVEQWVMQAVLDGAYKQKKPVLFFYWEPEWIHSAYDLRRLKEPIFTGYSNPKMKDDPQYNPSGCWNMVTAEEDPAWMEKSDVKCAWPTSFVYIGYAKALADRAPNVARFLKQVAFNSKTINDWILKIDREKMDPAEVAREWVANNSDTVNNWLLGVE
jgi:glycine betaine/proline transport system substrate-binding protein